MRHNFFLSAVFFWFKVNLLMVITLTVYTVCYNYSGRFFQSDFVSDGRVLYQTFPQSNLLFGVVYHQTFTGL